MNSCVPSPYMPPEATKLITNTFEEIEKLESQIKKYDMVEQTTSDIDEIVKLERELNSKKEYLKGLIDMYNITLRYS